MAICAYCQGHGYHDEVERERGDVFAYEIKRILCLACGATGQPAEEQIRAYAQRKEEQREAEIKLKETWAERADAWDRRQRAARHLFPEPGFSITVVKR